MSQVFIIHGAYGNPQENWIPWLKTELEKLNHSVIIPKFPTPEGQTLNNWNRVFKKYLSQITQDTIFVGHSLGPAFILNVLEQIDIRIKACFFISGFVDLLNNPQFDAINKTFVDKQFAWDKIKKNCSKFFIYHSDNDPYVPTEKANQFASFLDSKVHIISGGGHLNKAGGYSQFDLLLKNIQNTN